MTSEDLGAYRVYLTVMYEGPWERIATWLLAIDPDTLELKREIPPNHWRDRLAARCDRRNFHWIDKYAHSGSEPHPRWKRR